MHSKAPHNFPAKNISAVDFMSTVGILDLRLCLVNDALNNWEQSLISPEIQIRSIVGIILR